MTKAERARLLRAIQPSFPEFTVRAEQMRIEPIGSVLRCIYLDTSAYDKTAFYVVAFYQPLCTPFEHLAFSLGDRVRYHGIDGWYSTDPDVIPKLIEALSEHAVPFLLSLRTIERVLEEVEALPNRDAYVRLRTIAHIAGLLGDVPKAVAAIDLLVPTMDVNIDWQRDVRARSLALRQELLTDLPAAQARLRGWEDYTAKKLGIQQYR